MKKFVLIMLAFMASFSVYAQEVNTNNNEEILEERIGERVFLTGINIDMRTITYPYTIVIGIPFDGGEVLNVSGPADSNIPNWSLDRYNMMTINLYEDDLVGLTPYNIRYIEIATRNINYYVEVRGIF